jgi:hypothetical protein
MDDRFVIATALGKESLPTIDSVSGSTTWGFGYRDTIKSLNVTPLPSLPTTKSSAERRLLTISRS